MMQADKTLLGVMAGFMVVLSTVCGPGDRPDEHTGRSGTGRKERRESGRESRGIRSDGEKSTEWEPEFFIIPESRLGVTADESPVIPPDLIPEEDLWIMVRTPDDAIRPPEMSMGISIHDTRGMEAPLTLRHTTVDSRILGCVSDVTFHHRFSNEAEDKADLIYSITLPDNAGMSDFVLTMGDRKIRGVIREREDAERIFELARNRGMVASLVEDSGHNSIEGRMESVPPGTELVSSFRYFATLPYRDGSYRFTCPLTVMHDGSGTPESHESSVSVMLEAGVPIRLITSPTHEIAVVRSEDHTAKIQSRTPIVPSVRRFVMDYSLAGDETRAALLVDRSSNPGHAVLHLIPPGSYTDLHPVPLDLSILIDCSRSMRGEKLYTVKKSAEYILKTLHADDTYRVATFSGRSLTDAEKPYPGTDRHIRDTIRRIHAAPSTDGEGMLPGLRVSLPAFKGSVRYPVLILLTDGYIDDSGTIRRFIASSVGDTRIFVIVAGATTNTTLLETITRTGRGGLLHIGTDTIRDIIEPFMETVRRPVMRDITVDWGRARGVEYLPERLPDLHVGRPVVIAARMPDPGESSVFLSGATATGIRRFELTPRAYPSPAPALGFVWARKKLAGLMNQSFLSPNEDLSAEMASIADRYGIITPFTSYLMVDTRSGDG